MPIFTSLLFLFFALAILPLAFRGSPARQRRREQAALEERMALGASICIAAARQAFGVELDRSIASIAVLDALITNGWAAAPPSEPVAYSSQADSKDLTFVLASYIGTTFALHRAGEWRIENGKPALYFGSTRESEYPYELAELKFREPGNVNLSAETARWGVATESEPVNENDKPAE